MEDLSPSQRIRSLSGEQLCNSECRCVIHDMEVFDCGRKSQRAMGGPHQK